MSDEKQLIITGHENIAAVSIMLALGLNALTELSGNESVGKLEKQFADEVINQVQSAGGIMKDFPEFGDPDITAAIFMKKALAVLRDNIDNPPPPQKSKWQQRLEEVQAAQKEAEAREKFKNETSRFA